MAISIADMLGGLGAAMGGTGPQYVQGLKTREADARKQQMEEMEFRQKAMYEDANAAMQLFNQGDFSGIEQLGRDRLDMLRMFPDADPGDTARLTQLSMYAQRGDKPAIAQLHAELLNATRQGMARGYLQAPEQTKGVVVGENLVNPMTGEVIYQGQQKTTPYTDIAKLQQDLRNGLITQEQYDAQIVGMQKKPERPRAQDSFGVLRYIDTGEPVFPEDVQEPASLVVSAESQRPVAGPPAPVQAPVVQSRDQIIANNPQLSRLPPAARNEQVNQIIEDQRAGLKEQREFAYNMKTDFAKSPEVSIYQERKQQMGNILASIKPIYRLQDLPSGAKAATPILEKKYTGEKVMRAAGDIALIFSYMKMLDPTSVVREGEFKVAGEAGGEVLRLMNLGNKILNGEILPQDVRENLAQSAYEIYLNSLSGFEQALEGQKQTAESYGVYAPWTYQDYRPRKPISVEDAIYELRGSFPQEEETFSDMFSRFNIGVGTERYNRKQ